MADIWILIQDDPAPAVSAPIFFVESWQKEIDGLLEKGMFEVVPISQVPEGIGIFNSRFVDKIKNTGTATAFEKSRLVGSSSL